ncbi:MAG: ribosome maturation factor RimM [bacterium]
MICPSDVRRVGQQVGQQVVMHARFGRARGWVSFPPLPFEMPSASSLCSPLRAAAEDLDDAGGLDAGADADNVTTVEQDESVYIEIGIVGPPHGVKGEFKVQSLTDWPQERLGQKGTRYLRPPETTYHMARLQTEQPRITKVTLMRGQSSVYKGREVFICKIKGINTPEEARAIHGHTLMVHTSARDELQDDDEFYVQQLVGLRVELLEGGEEVGVVEDIMDGTGTHDVLQIVNAAGQAILLPFVKEIVPEVDMDAGVLRTTPPEGLLEVYTREIKKKSAATRRRPKRKL